MAKVKITNIEIKNPKDPFLSNIELNIFLDVREVLEEGTLSRPRLHDHLRQQP